MTIITLDTVRGRSAGLARGHGGGGPAPTRTVVAYGFWIFILSDIVHVFRPVRRLCGAVGQHRRRTDRAASCSICATCLSRPRACCSRATPAASACLSAERRQPAAFLLFAAAHLCPRRGLSVDRALRVRRHGGSRRRARAQRLSVELLHPGRHAWRPCHRRPRLARLHGGAGSRQGIACRSCCAGCCASACSGTRWTSSGSA